MSSSGSWPYHTALGARTPLTRIAISSALVALAACGGGGGGSSNNNNVTPGPTWTAGIYQPASSFKNQCASPRSGSSAVTGRAFPDMGGSVLSENNWLRSWTNELYLWYREVPDLNPAGYTTANYFGLLKTSQTTPSGTPKDQFHFSMATDKWEAFAQSGTSAGYGANFAVLKSSTPRRIVVASIEPGSPAANVGLLRGDEILFVDGADAVNGSTQGDVNALNSGLSPNGSGETHSFTLRTGATSRQVTLTSATITSTPVQNTHAIATPSGNVGYLLFNDHIATAESQLIAAINSLKSQNIVDLVLDIRYNGGGYLDIASELAYMIAGARSAGQTFETIVFNDKHPTTNPVTGESLSPTPFHTKARGFSTASGTALPTLDLNRVYVLTSGDTCSASEAVINGLRGVNVEVVQIGGTTCGKPYGFYGQDNCGTTYFSVQFKGVNAKGFGDYTDGFSPQNTLSNVGEPINGCSVADDFTHALGDANEAMLRTALDHRMGASCPSPSSSGTSTQWLKAGSDEEASEGALIKPQWRKNRIMQPAE